MEFSFQRLKTDLRFRISWLKIGKWICSKNVKQIWIKQSICIEIWTVKKNLSRKIYQQEVGEINTKLTVLWFTVEG